MTYLKIQQQKLKLHFYFITRFFNFYDFKKNRKTYNQRERLRERPKNTQSNLTKPNRNEKLKKNKIKPLLN